MDILIVDKDAKTDSLSSVMMLDIPDGVKFNQDSVKEYEEMMTDYLEEIAYNFIGAGNLNSEDSKNTPASICVMSESIQKMQIASLEEGRYFTEEDYSSSVPAIIIDIILCFFLLLKLIILTSKFLFCNFIILFFRRLTINRKMPVIKNLSQAKRC